MIRYRVALITCLTVGMGFAAVDVRAQDVRADQTFYLKPRVGLAHYHGDLTENFTFAFDNGASYSVGLELGYQVTRSFAIGIQSNFARFTALSPHLEDDDRSFHQLLVRYTARARTARVAPFIQAAIQGTDGIDDMAIGPAIGAGLDIALTERLFLMVEFMTQFALPDARFDGNGSEQPDFDFVSYVGPGLKYNFRSPFTAAEIVALECPSSLSVGQAATFTASTNSDSATPPVSYTWNWGDGTMADGSVATHTYTDAGTYTVTFTASNNGRSDSETCTVTVAPEPVSAEIVTLNASQTRFEVCEPVTIDFSAEVLGDDPVSYAWDFGDGSTGSGPQPSHTYSEPGTYSVTLRLSNAQGESTRSMTVTALPCTAGICYEISEMNSVFFGRNSSTLTEEAGAALDENTEIFEQCPNLCGRIIGFAAPGERNASELSEARARALESYYSDRGIPTSRFVIEGRGLVGDTTSKKEGTSQYRRVDTVPGQCEDIN